MARSLADHEKRTLEDLREYRRRLGREIAALTEKLKAGELSIESIKSGRPSSFDQALPSRGPSYASMPAQEAVERFLRENPKRVFTASEVADGLERRGFVPRSQNFKSQVGAALNRLSTKRVAARDKQEGVFVYRLSPPQPRGQ